MLLVLANRCCAKLHVSRRRSQWSLPFAAIGPFPRSNSDSAFHYTRCNIFFFIFCPVSRSWPRNTEPHHQGVRRAATLTRRSTNGDRSHSPIPRRQCNQQTRAVLAFKRVSPAIFILRSVIELLNSSISKQSPCLSLKSCCFGTAIVSHGR